MLEGQELEMKKLTQTKWYGVHHYHHGCRQICAKFCSLRLLGVLATYRRRGSPSGCAGHPGARMQASLQACRWSWTLLALQVGPSPALGLQVCGTSCRRGAP